jgi:hypothetical protein
MDGAMAVSQIGVPSPQSVLPVQPGTHGPICSLHMVFAGQGVPASTQLGTQLQVRSSLQISPGVQPAS